MSRICDYGCGQKAIHQFKNGKWCCSQDHRKCPAISKKRGEGLKKNWANRSLEELENFKKKQREITTEKWKDPTTKLGSVEHLRKISIASRNMSKESINKRGKKIKESWENNPERKIELSNRNKQMWTNGVFTTKEYRKNLKNGIKKGWVNNKKRKEVVSRKTKECWEDLNSKYHSVEKYEKVSKKLKIYWEDPNMRLKQSKRMIRYWADPIKREKARIRSTQNFEDPIYLKKLKDGLKHKPNKPEKTLINILNKLFFNEYVYVGDYSFWVGEKNPDFVCFKKKKVIEHFGTWWHGEKFTGIKNSIHERERINYFNEHGYDCLIIWESELVDLEQIKNKVKEFHRR